ncbi:Cof-type HAD-IIB family hydrolase [Pectinatus frisingensis]|uniref:Cof-type HAD-IIB family hydrolase n=1 Tax=Pectinatus frisingensis TaxID=865 RepID=UPI0018C45C76|nr:Cof-type HAD-IIB family hydrolase [Pectinatus frisingensis]
MPIKLIATDLDGTLLNDEKKVSPANIKAFQSAYEQGINITIATGRMHFAAAFFGKAIGANVPVISCNGAMIRDINTDEPIFETYIDDVAVEELLAFFFEHNIYCSWYIGTQKFAPYFSWDMFSGYHTVQGFNMTEVGHNYKPYTKKVTQVVIRSNTKIPLELTQMLEERFKSFVKFQQNTGYTIDITPPDITKAVGLKYLAEYLHIQRENIMTLGDGDNDVAMLGYAGTSAAMGNAIVPAKKAATFITDTCNADGVAKAINKVLNNNRPIN